MNTKKTFKTYVRFTYGNELADVPIKKEFIVFGEKFILHRPVFKSSYGFITIAKNTWQVSEYKTGRKVNRYQQKTMKKTIADAIENLELMGYQKTLNAIDKFVQGKGIIND